MAALSVVVFATPDDPGLKPLESVPAGVQVVVGHRAEDLRKAVAEADVLVHASGPPSLLAELWPEARRVRWVQSRSAGVDHLLFPALVESPVPLANARGVFSRALAEFVLTGALFFAKDVPRMVRGRMAGRWDPFEPESLHGRTLGVIGLGDIGRTSARLARSFGMRILALRRRAAGPADPDADEVLPADRIDDVMARADYVLVATPLTPDTRGLVDAGRIARMRPEAVLINVGRGPVVDEAALVEALRSGRLRGAALDVFEVEPLPPGHPLYALDNVLLSPHSADRIRGWREEALEVFVDNVRRFLAGQPLRNVVDKRRGY